jgi:Zn-dependent peptidase ImmA (M78 family)
VTYDPWRVLRDRLPDVVVGVVRLPRGRGWWMRGQRVILLDDRLTQAERRAVCAHEVEHALSDDDGCTCGPKAERRVRLLAARKLIPLDALVEALRWSRDESELADELWVDVDTVRTRLAGLTPAEQADIDSRLWALEESGAA